MAVHKHQLEYRSEGSLAERESWWHLCYDDQANRFYLEREWHNMNPYKSLGTADTGTATHELDEWKGSPEKLAAAKSAILEKLHA